MERADQILAAGHVDRRLAADRGIDLGEERGRKLDVADAAQQDCGRESGKIADHAAAQRDQRIAPFQAEFEASRGQPLQMGEGLGLLAGRQHDRIGRNARCSEVRHQGREIVRGDGLVGHDDGARPRQRRRDFRRKPVAQPVADQDVVAALGQGDPDARRRVAGRDIVAGHVYGSGRRARSGWAATQSRSASATRSVISPSGWSTLATAMSASA